MSEYLRLLPDPYRIREESRKVWEYCESNEIVHLGEVIEAKLETFVSVVDCQLSSTVWIELNFVLVGQRDSYYRAIIDLLRPDLLDSGQAELPLGNYAVSSDMPMLLNVPQLVEPPQMSRVVVVPSVIRLKRFNNVNGVCGHSSSRFSNKFPSVGIVSLANGEGNFGTGDGATQVSQLPCKMVQASPQIQNEVSCHQGSLQHSVIMETLNPNDVPAIFRIIFGRNCWGVQVLDNKRFACKFVEAFLRPLQFKIRIEEARGHLIPGTPPLGRGILVKSSSRDSAERAEVRREHPQTLEKLNCVDGAALKYPDTFGGPKIDLNLSTPVNDLALVERAVIVNVLINDDPFTHQRLIAKDGHYNLRVP